MLSLALFVVLSQAELSTPPPPPVSEPPSAGYGVTANPQRSASLIDLELAKLQQELKRYQPKPTWLPVTLGLVVGLGLGGLTAAIVILSPPGFAAIPFVLLGFCTAFFGVAAIVVGVILAGIFTRSNERAARRAEDVQRRIDQLKAQPQSAVSAPWQGGLAEVAPLTPVFTF